MGVIEPMKDMLGMNMTNIMLGMNMTNIMLGTMNMTNMLGMNITNDVKYGR